MTLPIPGKNLYKLFAILIAVALLAGFWDPAVLIWQVAMIIAATLAILDLLRLYRSTVPEAERNIHTSIPLGVKRTVSLRLTNPSQYPITFDVIDHFPNAFDAVGLPLNLSLGKEGSAEFSYQITAKARGKFNFIGVQFHLYSPWLLCTS